MLDKDYLVKGEMYQYNLGWLIEELMSFKQDLATAIDLKTIKYADPIQWDITTQYPANTVVVDPKSGTAYMSKIPVPAGVELNNTNYWVVVFNYQDIYNKIMDGVAFNDRDQDYATKDLLVNDLVWYAGDLYRATREIPAGSKYIPGTNLIKTTIESLLARYYGRDRMAQISNDTVNVSGDYTLAAGDIAETSTNRTIKVTKDREVDVDGSDSVHVDGASTLNVGGLRTEVYAGDKTEGVTGAYTGTYRDRSSTYTGKHIDNYADHSVDRSKVTPGYLNAVSYGAVEESDDIAPIINQLVANHDEVIYLPKGTYKAKTSLIFNRYRSHFICDGKIVTSADIGISIRASDCTVKVNVIEGQHNGTGIGIQHGDEEMTQSYGNSVISAQFIWGFDTGLRLYANNENGIQNDIINLCRIDDCNIGIELACGNIGANWVNQNTFYGGWIAGGSARPNAKGIKFTKSANMTDPFNGNAFNYFSCEQTRYPIDIEYANNNIFNNFRLYENTGTDLIKCTNDTFSNKFIGLKNYVAYNSINDRGNMNDYKLTFASAGINICERALFCDGNFIPMKEYLMKTDYSFTQSASLPPTALADYIDIDASAYNVIVALSVKYSYIRTANSFIVDIKGIASITHVELRLFNGTVIASSQDVSGISGIQLKANTKYLFVPIDNNKYKVTEL